MRSPCGVRKGAWSEEEDILLRNCIAKYGEGRWHLVPTRAGLSRCRKSCRLRWLNYLRPDIKRGDFSSDEVDLIFRLHKLLGNRWSLIAGRLPGRTANDVKNYWNTHLVKKMVASKPRMELGEGKPPDHINRSIDSTNPTASRTVIVKPRPRAFSKNTGWQIKKKTAISAEFPRTMEEIKDSTTRPPPAPVQTEETSNNILPYEWDNKILSVESEGTTWPYFDGGSGAVENGMTSLCSGELSNLEEGAKDGAGDCNQEGQLIGSSFFSIDPEFWDLNFYYS